VSSLQGTLASEDRLERLSQTLAADGSVGIAAAAEAFGVSEMTIRRDLLELEQRGLARRVRGGARAVGPMSFAERRDAAPRAKAKIASKLAALVPTSGVIAFDASTTVMRVVATIGSARDLTVLTNGSDTFSALQGLPGVTPLLTGGRLDPQTGSLVGPIACRAASDLTVQTFFASAAAVDPGAGAIEMTLEEAEVKRTIASRAGEIVLAADSSKLGRRAVAVGVPWDAIDVLVTELDAGDRRLDPYRDLVEVL
jgi:DeoR family fructose operon transcriptional repressor